MRFFQTQKHLAIYLLILSLFGMLMVLLVTFRFGPGASTDGARYLASAQNLIDGNGLVDYLNLPLTQFPPLYSLLIAGISLITGLDVFVAGQYLNVLTFGLVIWLAGYFFYKIFPDQPLFAYFGSAIFATSVSLIIMASNILSDLLFMVFVLAFLIVATDVLEVGAKSIILMGLIAALSPFQRYAGLALIFTGAVLILFLYRKNLIRGVLLAGLFGMVTALPILLWVYFHNYVQTGILFGVRMPPVYFGNFIVTLEKAEHWFLPSVLTSLMPLWAIAAIVFLILITGNRLADWKRWSARFVEAQFLPSFVFFIIYLLVLVFNVSYWEVRYPYMDRIHIMILPALLTLMFLTLRELTPKYLRNLTSQRAQVLSIAVFLIWLMFPIYNLQKYVRRAVIEGETSEFNMYNVAVLRDSGIREFLSAQAVGDSKIYSNYEAAAWFITRHAITKLPFGEVGTKRIENPEEVLEKFPDWPGEDGAGYVVWIKALSFKPYVLQPEQLAGRADFELVYLSKGGIIYRLTPR